MAASLLAATALLLVAGRTPLVLCPLTFVLLTETSSWQLGAIMALGLASAWWSISERRQQRQLKRQREDIREVLEALSESTRLESDMRTAVRLGLSRCTTPLAQAVIRLLEDGADVESAFQGIPVEAFRTIGAVLGHCRRCGARPLPALALLRDEFLQRWRLEEESEAAISLMRGVSTALALLVLFLAASFQLGARLFSGPAGPPLLAFILGNVLLALLLPRAVTLA